MGRIGGIVPLGPDRRFALGWAAEPCFAQYRTFCIDSSRWDQRMSEEESKKSPLGKRALREAGFWIRSFVLAAAIVLPLRAAVADWYDVPTGSMRPTILEGDRIFVRNLAFGLRVPMTRSWIARWGEPQRGQIVTLASPESGERLVKRVVAVPGDRISMVQGRLIVNGDTLNYDLVDEDVRETVGESRVFAAEHYMEHLPGQSHIVTHVPAIRARRDFEEIVLPEDRYFVMGDNRDQSRDSRYFGLVEEHSIYGHTTHIAISFWPETLLKPRFSRWMGGVS
jgi:signal peptidase I